MNSDLIETEVQLEDLLSRPPPGVIEVLRRLDGDILLLGVGGKIGPSLARMAKRAAEAAGVRRRVIGVSRLAKVDLADQLHDAGVETIACDFLDEAQVSQLPEVRNVIFLAGMKFGSTMQPAMTWAVNSYLPAVICRKYRRSRILAYSTGNIYGLTPVGKGGSQEQDAPNPVGEYAMSCLGRERIFEYFSHMFQIPAALFRLNYACELRYGVLVDLAQRVWTGQPVELTMGYFNTIWQGDANAIALQTLGHASAPPLILNVTGPEQLSVRELAKQFGQLMGKRVNFVGQESAHALLSNAQASHRLFGPPQVGIAEMVQWIAHWVMQGGSSLEKPTRFESPDGKF
jgi:nucleoside-diphosphate-sugar epimerase